MKVKNSFRKMYLGILRRRAYVTGATTIIPGAGLKIAGPIKIKLVNYNWAYRGFLLIGFSCYSSGPYHVYRKKVHRPKSLADTDDAIILQSYSIKLLAERTFKFRGHSQESMFT